MRFTDKYRGVDIKQVDEGKIESLEEANFVLGELDSVMREIEGQITRYHKDPSARPPGWLDKSSRALRGTESARRRVMVRKAELTPRKVQEDLGPFVAFYQAAKDVLESSMLRNVFSYADEGDLEETLEGTCRRLMGEEAVTASA